VHGPDGGAGVVILGLCQRGRFQDPGRVETIIVRARSTGAWSPEAEDERPTLVKRIPDPAVLGGG
jgi:hypothetical protein